MSAEQGQSPESDVILAVLRRHSIGAFNGSQVACAAPECRVYMATDLWRVHQADLIAEALSLSVTPPAKGNPGGAS